MALKGTTATPPPPQKQALTYSVSQNTGHGPDLGPTTQGQDMATGAASHLKENRLDGYAQRDISRMICVGLGQ